MNTDLPTGEAKSSQTWLIEKIENLGLTPKRVLEYLAMFTILTVIYYCYFVRDAKANASAADIEVTFSQLGVMIARFLIFTSWPFALMAAYDRTWTSKEAGHVFLAAYLVTNILWYHVSHCLFCIFAASFRIIPYVFCAWAAHGIGAWRHRAHQGEEE